MTAFSVAPAGNTPFPAQTPDNFPQFIQFQSNGVNLGGPDADTLDFGPGLIATRGVGENAGIVSVEPGVLFRSVLGDGAVTIGDINNCIVLDGTSGVQAITLDSGVLLPGQSVLVVQRGTATGEIIPDSGITLLYRSGAFLAATAGQGAALTLIMMDDGATVLVCGDMLAL